MGTLVKVKENGNHVPSIPSFFDDFFTRDLFNRSNNNYSEGMTLPAVNIRETDNSYELEVAAPGMEKRDFKVELDNDQLIICAEKEEKNEEKNEKYTRKEFSYRSFKRSFTLPERMVNGDKIKAKCEDGILRITVPKSEEAKTKPAKIIQVS